MVSTHTLVWKTGSENACWVFHAGKQDARPWKQALQHAAYDAHEVIAANGTPTTVTYKDIVQSFPGNSNAANLNGNVALGSSPRRGPVRDIWT